MRALLFPFGSQGDVRPLIAIGAALKTRGHEAILGANPRFEGMAEAVGLELDPIGTVEEYTAVLDSPDLWHATRGPKLLHEYSFGPDLKGQAVVAEKRANDDTVIIAGTFAIGAWLTARKLGRPCVKIQGQPAALFGPHDPPMLPSGKKLGGPMWLRRFMLGPFFDATVFRRLGKDLNAAREEYGLEPWPSRFMTSYVDADLNLCLFPDWYAPVNPDWPETAKHVGFFVDPPEGASDLDPALSQFLDAGEAPLVFTPGPAGYQHGEKFFEIAAGACAELGERAVFVTRGQKLAAELPDTVLACDYAPFGQLFPRARLLVHHGGIGSVAHGLAAGRPQLITPFGFDQPDNAFRLATLGAGDLLMSTALSPKKLAAKVREMLASSEMADAARKLGEKMAADSTVPVEVACDLIEGLPG